MNKWLELPYVVNIQLKDSSFKRTKAQRWVWIHLSRNLITFNVFKLGLATKVSNKNHIIFSKK